LPDVRKEHFHVLAVRFRKPRTTCLILFQLESVDLCGLSQETVLEIPHVRLRQVLVFTDKDNGRDPKLFGLVLLQSLPNNLSLANVSSRCVSYRIAADEDIDAGLFQFLPGEKIVEFRTWRCNRFSGPVRDLRCAQTLCISPWKKKLDGRRCH
jgi:hypothetical protein